MDIGKDPKSGKRKQKRRSGFKTKKEAQAASAELIAQFEKGEYIHTSNQTLAEFLAYWLEKQAKKVLRESTFSIHNMVIQSRIIPEIGHLPLKDLHPLHISDFYDTLSNEEYSNDYIRYIHNILKKSLKKAVAWELISKNIMDHVDPPRLKAKDISTWTMEESNTFMESAKENKFYIVFLLALYTGMRRGEILGLRWKHVDFENRNLSVTQTLYRTREKGLIFQEPKTKNAKRQIALPGFVIEELKKHKLEQNKIKLALGAGYQDHQLVNCYEDGRPIDPRNILKHFERVTQKAGVPRLRFHDLRHTHATILLQLRENPKVVSERLGHSNIGITLDTYSHVIPDMQQDTADKFEQAMKLSRSKQS